MRLAKNEFEYVETIVRRASDRNSEGIILVDQRPFMLPEDLKAVRDEDGRPVPPYELGCFSGYCMQTTAIVHVAAQELGFPLDRFEVKSERAGLPTPGFTCAHVTDPELRLPAGTSKTSILTMRYYRSLRSPICENYSLKWHRLLEPPKG